jgi:hypothetical protein
MTINFITNFGKNSFVNGYGSAKYDSANKPVLLGDVAGSVSFSKITLQAAKAALENKTTKAVEFLLEETNRKTVFDGTYTARKGDIFLNKVYIDEPTPNAL